MSIIDHSGQFLSGPSRIVGPGLLEVSGMPIPVHSGHSCPPRVNISFLPLYWDFQDLQYPLRNE